MHMCIPHVYGMCTQVFYEGDNHSHVVCDGSGEDYAHGIDQYWLYDSVWDHLHYYGETIGEDGC